MDIWFRFPSHKVKAELFDNILTNLGRSVAMVTAECAAFCELAHMQHDTAGGDVTGKAGITGKREQLELAPRDGKWDLSPGEYRGGS